MGRKPHTHVPGAGLPEELPRRKLGSMGTSRMGPKNFSKYFSPSHEPIVSVCGLPLSEKLLLLMVILKGNRAEAEKISNARHLEKGSIDMLASRSITGIIGQSRNLGMNDAVPYLEAAIGIAGSFNLPEERDEAVIELCRRLKDDFQPHEAAYLASRKLPKEKSKALFEEWLEASSTGCFRLLGIGKMPKPE